MSKDCRQRSSGKKRKDELFHSVMIDYNRETSNKMVWEAAKAVRRGKFMNIASSRKKRKAITRSTDRVSIIRRSP